MIPAYRPTTATAEWPRCSASSTAQPIADTRYVDSHVCDVDTRYAVSAVYAGRGESKACEPIVLNVNGAGVDAPEMSGITVRGVRNAVVIDNAVGMRAFVCDMQGRLVASPLCGAREVIGVAPGVYVVKAGNKAVKIIVR
ncbi:MAG: DUF6383 domain-containing protein [Candidatus Amulumruptor caecigallinarius]|nr:DUF6383 domain-containing protein [Candidatus Amulumruptor caecigallinarius]